MPRAESPSSPLRPAVFLDRDGTINRELDYLRRPQDLQLLRGAAAAIARLNRAGFACIVITNQSGIARGLLDEEELQRIHLRLDELLESAGAHIDHYEFCPHHPEIGSAPYRLACDCRKPGSAMLERATRHIGVDLKRSWSVGDSPRDLEAGAALGLPGLLVKSGKPVSAESRERYTVVEDLAAAVQRILSGSYLS